MRRIVLLAAVLCGCDPVDLDLDIDLDLGGAPVVGEYGAVTFAFVDGCSRGDAFWGCRSEMPPVAIGAHVRFVVGSVSAEVDDDRRIAHATPRSVQPLVADAAWDADGFLVVDARAQGATVIELADEAGVIDRLGVVVAPVTRLASHEGSTVLLAGATIGARIDAFGPSGQLLYAHGAISVITGHRNLVPIADTSGYFWSTSDQLAVAGVAPGPATATFVTKSTSVDVTYQIVDRDAITKVTIAELWHDSPTNKVSLRSVPMMTTGQGDETYVRGSPPCDWSIVSGTAEISSRPVDDMSGVLIAPDALVYGSGVVVVECRANATVAGQLELQLASP